MNRRISVPPTEMSNGSPATPEVPGSAQHSSADPGECHNPVTAPRPPGTTPQLDPFRFSPEWSAAPVAPSSPERLSPSPPVRCRRIPAARCLAHRGRGGSPSGAGRVCSAGIREVGRGRSRRNGPAPRILLREPRYRRSSTRSTVPASAEVHLNASGRSDTVLASGLVKTQVPGRYTGPWRQVRSA